MSKVVGIRFHPHDQIYFFSYQSSDLKPKAYVIVETEQGTESGIVDFVNPEFPEARLEHPLKPILRPANAEDLQKISTYRQKELEASATCRDRVHKYDLPMKLVGTKYSFDGSRLTFYFTAESRVDFRDLVKDLTRTFQKSIRLQQVGSRDAAGAIGGHGLCGQQLCCARYLNDFKSITTDMARRQQMAHRGSDRISGPCGRLICCLSYEEKAYEELSRKMPPIRQTVNTPSGKGIVISVNVISQSAEVDLQGQEGRKIIAVKDLTW